MGIEKEERVWCTYKVCYLKQHKTKTKTSGHLAIILQRLYIVNAKHYSQFFYDLLIPFNLILIKISPI